MDEGHKPTLPRRRSAPARVESGKAPPEFPKTAKDRYRSIYYEAVDLIVTFIKDRFDQDDYKMYANCEQLLLKAATGDDYKNELTAVTNFYGSDFKTHELQTHLNTLTHNMPSDDRTCTTLADVLKYLRSLSGDKQQLMSQVIKLAKLILVMPATNATSERSFSALRRIKTYLRTTMTQDRMNNLMCLYVHKDKTSYMDIVKIANDFVAQSKHRLDIFGKFAHSDLSRSKTLQRHKSTQTSK